MFMWRSFYRTGGFIDEERRTVYKMKNLNHVNVFGALIVITFTTKTEN